MGKTNTSLARVEKYSAVEEALNLIYLYIQETYSSTAWKKLFDFDCPFDISSCNLLAEDSSDNAIAGAGILNKILCGIRHDSPRIIIGLFDNDKAGQEEYKLDANYKLNEDARWKKHKNGQGYAVILPDTGDLQKISKIKNLSIEYLFSKESLEKEIDGKKLRFEKGNKVVLINGMVAEQETAGVDDLFWYYSKIDDSTKNDFANYIVPNLEKEEFENFRPLFDIVTDILETIE